MINDLHPLHTIMNFIFHSYIKIIHNKFTIRSTIKIINKRLSKLHMRINAFLFFFIFNKVITGKMKKPVYWDALMMGKSADWPFWQFGLYEICFFSFVNVRKCIYEKKKLQNVCVCWWYFFLQEMLLLWLKKKTIFWITWFLLRATYACHIELIFIF